MFQDLVAAESKWQKWTRLLLYPFAAGLFMLHFVRVFDNAFWGDEGFTLRLTQMTIPEMLSATSRDVHPPLYYLWTKLLFKLFGHINIIAHLSSVIPYGLILLFAVTLVRKKFGTGTAYVLATMSSVIHSTLVYNVEARMYSLAAFFTLLSFLSLYFVLTDCNSARHWSFFCAASLGAAYTHYYALISVAFFYLMLIIVSVFRKEYRKGTFISSIVTIILYLPWLAVLMRAVGRVSGNFWLQEIPSLKSCVYFLLENKKITCLFLAAGLLNLIYHFVVVTEKKEEAEWVIKLRKASFTISETDIWLLSGLLSLGGTIGVGIGISRLLRPLFITRYLFPLAPVIYLIMGYFLNGLKIRKLWIPAFIVFVLVTCIPGYKYERDKEKELNYDTAEFLEAVKTQPGDYICTDNVMLNWTLLEYYYPQNSFSLLTEPWPFPEAAEQSDVKWLFWSEELTDPVRSEILQQESECEELFVGRLGSVTVFHVYRITK